MIPASIQAIVKSQVTVFHSLPLARNYVDRCRKLYCIILGDHDDERGEYWVVTPADAQRLERQGYEFA
jgi:hypothetical protein